MKIRTFRELVHIRRRFFELNLRLIRESPLPLWRIESSSSRCLTSRHLWLEFGADGWSLKPNGSEQKHPILWLEILEAIKDATC